MGEVKSEMVVFDFKEENGVRIGLVSLCIVFCVEVCFFETILIVVVWVRVFGVDFFFFLIHK